MTANMVPGMAGGEWPARATLVFLCGQVVSLLGDGLAVLAIPLLVLGLSHSPLISALSAASLTIGYLAVGLPAGVLVDRLDAWRVLVITDALRAVLFGVAYLALITGLTSVWPILLIALAAGAASVFFQTALVVLVKDLFSGPALLRSNALLELASQGALLAGPAIVGVLAATGDMRAALLADALTFVASLVSLIVLRRLSPQPASGARPAAAARRGPGPATAGAGTPGHASQHAPASGTPGRASQHAPASTTPGRASQHAPASGTSHPARPRLTRWRDFAADFREGIHYLLSVRVLVILTAVQVVVNLCLAAEKLIFYYARDTLGLSPQDVSAVVAMAGAGGVVGALAAARLAAWMGQLRLIVVAIAAAGVAMALMSAATSMVPLMAANFAYAWAVTAASLVNRTQRQRIVPRDLLGRVTASVRLIFLAVDPLGVVVAGLAAQALGGDPAAVFVVAGAVTVAAAAAGWLAGLRGEVTATDAQPVTGQLSTTEVP